MSYIEHKSEESLEDYLEVILILSQKLPFVRSIDIASELNFSKPSVSVAMKKLKGREYISISDEGYISLTEAGKEIAEKVYECHRLLTDWLVPLSADPLMMPIPVRQRKALLSRFYAEYRCFLRPVCLLKDIFKRFFLLFQHIFNIDSISL